MSALRMYQRSYRCFMSAFRSDRLLFYESKRFVSLTYKLEKTSIRTNVENAEKTNSEDEQDLDYFGIEGNISADPQSYEPLNKYLKTKLESPAHKSDDKIVLTRYGHIRYDTAKPKPPEAVVQTINSAMKSSTEPKVMSFQEKRRWLRKKQRHENMRSLIDDQYFDYQGSFAQDQNVEPDLDSSSAISPNETPKRHAGTTNSRISSTNLDGPDNFIDKQYFQYDGNVEQLMIAKDVQKSSNHPTDFIRKSHQSDSDITEIDSQYFSDVIKESDNQALKDVKSYNTSEQFTKDITNSVAGDFSEVDAQYLTSYQGITESEEQASATKTDRFGFDAGKRHVSHAPDLESNIGELNEIDSQYFATSLESSKGKGKKTSGHFKSSETLKSQNALTSTINTDDMNEIDAQYFATHQESSTIKTSTIVTKFEKAAEDIDIKQREVDDFTDVSPEHFSKSTKKHWDKPGKRFGQTEKIESIEGTALEAALKVRQDVERKGLKNLYGVMNPNEYDSKGFRILTNQVPHFDYAIASDVVKVLRSAIIYNERDIVAINKPYNMPSQDGPKVPHSITKYKDDIIPGTSLHPIHRLDKETTGVMLFAKTQAMASELRAKFYQRDVIKRYYAITKNYPHLPRGEIDIPIRERVIDGRERMVLQPYMTADLKKVMKDRQTGQDAVTRYRVIDRGDRCALVECIPTTGKKHQIRVHLAMGLDCPILGDHKYSHSNRYAPQRLHPAMLKQLKVQQAKVRHLAMHLHAWSITIPGFLNGRNFYVSAPLPPHFKKNLHQLNMKFRTGA